MVPAASPRDRDRRRGAPAPGVAARHPSRLAWWILASLVVHGTLGALFGWPSAPDAGAPSGDLSVTFAPVPRTAPSRAGADPAGTAIAGSGEEISPRPAASFPIASGSSLSGSERAVAFSSAEPPPAPTVPERAAGLGRTIPTPPTLGGVGDRPVSEPSLHTTTARSAAASALDERPVFAGAATAARTNEDPSPHLDSAPATSPDGAGQAAELARIDRSPAPDAGRRERRAYPIAAGDASPAPSVGQAAPVAGNPAPRYPRTARRRGIEGRLVLQVLVDATGAARSVEVFATSGHGLLDEAAIDAVRRWRFVPGHRDGQAAPTLVRVPVTFKLDRSS